MWPTSYFDAPTSRPITCRIRVRVPPAHDVAWVGVKQAAPPQGPFAPVICASVSRFRTSLPSISMRRMAVSDSYTWVMRLTSATLAAVTLAAPKYAA